MVVKDVMVERSVGFSSNRVFRLVGRDVTGSKGSFLVFFTAGSYGMSSYLPWLASPISGLLAIALFLAENTQLARLCLTGQVQACRNLR